MARLGLKKSQDLSWQNWAAHPTKNSEGYPSELQTPAVHVYVVEGFTGNAFPESEHSAAHIARDAQNF